MQTLTLIIAILSSSSISSVITLLINQKSNKAKLEGQGLINTEKLIKILNETIDELRLARKEISALTDEVEKLKTTNDKLKAQISSLQTALKKFNSHENGE